MHPATFSNECEKKEEESMEIFLYRKILQNNVQSIFCNAEIALRIYLSMMVTNCSGERSFSKLKISTNRLQTSMKQDRLTNLMLLSLESDILLDLSFDDLITTFANKKPRKAFLV